MTIEPFTHARAADWQVEAFPEIGAPDPGPARIASAAMGGHVSDACGDLATSIMHYAGLLSMAQEQLDDARRSGRTADLRETLRQMVQLAAAASELCDRFRKDCTFEKEVDMYLQIKVTALCRKLEQIGDAAEEGLAALGHPGLGFDLGAIGDLAGGAVDLMMGILAGLGALLGGQRAPAL